MIELPFGNGVTTALIFFVFELILLPILMDSTTKAASFFVHQHARKGNHIRVSTPSYPLWSEGLFSRPRIHALIFLIRMVCIVIPVYLETRLQFFERTVEVTTQLRNSFVIKPKDDVPFEIDRTFSSLNDVLEVIDTCSYIDENGWIIASMANVTYTPDQHLDGVLCVRGTAVSTFRIKQFRPAADIHLPHENDLNVSLTYPERLIYDDERLKKTVVEARVRNAKDVECFIGNTIGDISNDGNDFWSLFCHKLNDSWIDYFHVEPPVTYKPPQFAPSKSGTTVVDSENRALYIALPETSQIPLRFLARAEFKKGVLMSAKHLFSTPSALFARDMEEMRREFGFNLYSNAQNVSVRIPRDADGQHTIVDDQTLIICAMEIGFIFASGITMTLLFRWKKIAAPNTLDDISQNWASFISHGSRTAETDHIKLSLTSEICQDVVREVYVPTNSNESCSSEMSLSNPGGPRRARWLTSALKCPKFLKKKSAHEDSGN